MYMSGIPVKRVGWANKLCSAACMAGHNYKLSKGLEIIFWLPKNGVRSAEITGGCADVLSHRVELMVDNIKETEYKRFVIVHETAHILDYAKHGIQRTKSGRNIYHGTTFWEIAIPLYIEFDLLHEAKAREYVRGREIIKDLLES